jgi:hypothetical protein
MSQSSPPEPGESAASTSTLPKLPRHRLYAIAAEACVDLRVVQRYFGIASPRRDRPHLTNAATITPNNRERIERALRTLKLERYLRTV